MSLETDPWSRLSPSPSPAAPPPVVTPPPTAPAPQSASPVVVPARSPEEATESVELDTDPPSGPAPRLPERLLPPERTVVVGRRVARRRERRRRWTFAVVVVAVVAASVSTVVFVLPHHHVHKVLPPPAAYGPAPPSIAWGLSWSNGSLGDSLAILGVPPGDPAFAVVAVDDARVDLPGGAALTVGPATGSGPAAIETAQALLDRRVGHYVISTPSDIAALVDRLGGITFDAQSSVLFNGVPVGPGHTTANGAQVRAYLLGATSVGRWVRWEDVLSGLLDSRDLATAWARPPGKTDDASAVAALLRDAHGATVVDLPTSHEFGILKADTEGVDAMLDASFKGSVGGLMRVIVQNGNGLPGMGQQVGELLAPYGYRVIDSQNASSFDEPETKILASGQRYLKWADEAQGLLGAGKVYLDPQPTGIADIVIIVGKDFGAG